MGNSAGKENDINNLMHVTIVKDADLPKDQVAQNNASVWKIINERYWELEMNKFKGFDEFNFFRAVNPAFHVEKEEKKAGIVVGDQDTFQMYKELYDFCYTDAYTEEKKEEEEGEKNADQIEDEEEPAPPVPETRLLNFNANNLPNVEDVTALKRLYLKAERNIIGLPLLPGIISEEQFLEIRDVLVTACKSFEGMLEIKESNTFKLDEVKPKKLKELTDRGIVGKPEDPYSKSAGVARWWPQGRVVANGVDNNFKIVMNQYEHLKVEWTVRHGSYVNAFHTFFKSLNNFHKHLKRKQLGGFWKDPKYGYISVDPTKFGTMFTCELDFIVHAIPMYFSKEEFVEECADVLGILVIPLESDQRNMFTMRVKDPQWMDEVEQLGLLLDSINRLSQSDRSLYFSPRNAGDTLFKFE